MKLSNFLKMHLLSCPQSFYFYIFLSFHLEITNLVLKEFTILSHHMYLNFITKYFFHIVLQPTCAFMIILVKYLCHKPLGLHTAHWQFSHENVFFAIIEYCFNTYHSTYLIVSSILNHELWVCIRYYRRAFCHPPRDRVDVANNAS